MYVYVTCVPECCGSVCCASQLSWEATPSLGLRVCYWILLSLHFNIIFYGTYKTRRQIIVNWVVAIICCRDIPIYFGKSSAVWTQIHHGHQQRTVASPRGMTQQNKHVVLKSAIHRTCWAGNPAHTATHVTRTARNSNINIVMRPAWRPNKPKVCGRVPWKLIEIQL
jgi:hypothetical protein